MNHRDVATIQVSATVRQAASKMESRCVGSLVVLDDHGEAIGIVTDRDLCIRAVAFDRDPDSSTVERAMTAPLLAIGEDQPPRAHVDAIREGAARRLPIVNAKGQPTAIVTADDELRWIADVLSSLSKTARASRFHGALRPAGALLDDLERHLDVTERVDESDGLSCASMMDAINKLRKGLTKSQPRSNGPA